MCVNDDDPNVKDQLLLQRSGTGNNSEPCAPSTSVSLENFGGLTEEKMPSGISVSVKKIINFQTGLKLNAMAIKIIYQKFIPLSTWRQIKTAFRAALHLNSGSAMMF